MNKPLLARTLHKWFGLIVGLQVSIWLATGLYMVIVNLDFIHGDPLVKNMQQVVTLPDSSQLTIAALQALYPQATQVALRGVAGKVYYLVTTTNQRYLINPQTAEVVSPLAPKSIRNIALHHYQDDAPIDRLSLIETNPPAEIGQRPLPLWRVDFKDDFQTSFYIDPYSGALVTRRHQYWRIFDFLWSLHIMDYRQRSNANNLLLKSAQGFGMTLAITGLWLLYYRLKQRNKSTWPRSRLLRKIHKWLSLLIGLQVSLWLLSGIIMAQLDPEKVSGEKWQQKTPSRPQLLTGRQVLEPQQLPTRVLQGALGISLEVIRQQPVYRIRRHQGELLVDATDGSNTYVDQQLATTLAVADFSGNGHVTGVLGGTAPDRETRNSTGAYWRVNFSDPAQTSIYVSASTGAILERRNHHWRWFDLAWMLHIMDYSGRQNFNNSLIITVALIAVWLGISGVILLFSSFRRKDFKLQWKKA